MESNRIEELIRQGIPGADVRAVDVKGTGDHFEVLVVADAFEGCSMVQQHRMVYAALGDSMRQAIHALIIKAITPEQYRAGLVTDIGRTD